MSKELNFDCLLNIFQYTNRFEDLVVYSKVCSKWRIAAFYRLSQIKYLSLEPIERPNEDCLISKYFPPPQYMVYSNPANDNPTHLFHDGLLNYPSRRYLKELRNLRIVDIGAKNSFSGNLSEFLMKNREIKGLIGTPDYNTGKFLDKIEIIACYTLNWVNKPMNLKQLHIEIGISSDFSIFQDLLRLHSNESFYNCLRPLTNLKILEIGTSIQCGYAIIDSCPNLESAYIFFRAKMINALNKTNLNLRNLVIQNTGLGQEWNSLRAILSRFPNLRNLAIRGNDTLNDHHVRKLLDMLPHVKLLDFRGSRKVTKKSASYLVDFNKRNKRSIKFYYSSKKAESLTWPKIIKSHEKICYGFDFMENCFFRTFQSLPLILEPKISSHHR
ncbi:uncharacterized protein LOC128393966 [Panonychus citri]|uniref:uncharacterized protein LOC128393966 n=1 Tax=Panonychus citri TaxID=50023 RepID=UPI0023071A9E|nr:uncharacterized protein LOC128393966 [Panonychus citri]